MALIFFTVAASWMAGDMVEMARSKPFSKTGSLPVA
jgi:ribosomal protein S17